MKIQQYQLFWRETQGTWVLSHNQLHPTMGVNVNFQVAEASCQLRPEQFRSCRGSIPVKDGLNVQESEKGAVANKTWVRISQLKRHQTCLSCFSDRIPPVSFNQSLRGSKSWDRYPVPQLDPLLTIGVSTC